MRAARQCTARVHSRPEAVETSGAASRCRSQSDRCCSICREPALENVVDAGGDVGVVHRACFVRWDTEEEALEQMLARSLGVPHHAEANLELEPAPLAAAKSSLPRVNSVARADLVRSAAA
jgi:hypothetical protein